MKNPKLIATRIPGDIHKQLRTIAFKKNCSMQMIIIDSLKHYFNQIQQQSLPKQSLPEQPFQEDLLNRFNQFWAAYPNKKSKVYCKKIWEKLNPTSELLEAMLNALEWQRKTKQWKDGFIPNPSTWLNQQRWEDAPKEHLSTSWEGLDD